jgi:uncharacterized membrane protein
MPKKKKNNKDLDEDGWKTCSFCGDSVKAKNFERHLERVHLGMDDDEDDVTEERRSRNRSNGARKKRSELRKEMVQDRRRKHDIYMFVGMLVAILAIVAGYYLSTGTGPGDNDNNDGLTELSVKKTEAVPGTDEIRIPVSDVDDGRAHFYYFDTNGVRVNYFVLESSDGVIRAAFDTCDVCYDAKKGYHQEGDQMVCNNCGQRFQSTNINELKGGCNPAPLTRTISGGNVIITTDSIEEGKWYFE